MSEIRRHLAGMFAPVVTSDRNSFVPSIVSAACCSKKSKKLVSRGRNRPNMQPPTRACNTAVTGTSPRRPRKLPGFAERSVAQVPNDQGVHAHVVHDPCVGGVDLGERGHAVEPGLVDR